MKISLGILLVLLLLLQYQLWFTSSGYFRTWGLRQQLAYEQKITKKLVERNKVLKAEVENLKQGHEAVEELARTQLGMIKEGETFYRMLSTEKKAQSNH